MDTLLVISLGLIVAGALPNLFSRKASTTLDGIIIIGLVAVVALSEVQQAGCIPAS